MNLQEIKDIRIEDFDYPLPDERIAKHPLADRDSCKLLVHADGRTTHHTFSDLPDLLPDGALLVMNNTRVINARMEFHRASGARIEIFLLEPLVPRDYAQAFQTRRSCRWQCLVGNLKKWKDDYLEKNLEIAGRHVTLRAIRHESLTGNAHSIEFEWDDEQVTFASIVEAAGNIPIPPYLNRDSEASDTTDYQTVYSRIQGSVAAPTAGLHFTPELLDKIRSRGIETREVTLHVGAGTFQPVKSEEIGAHPMHRETFEIDLDLVRALRQAIETGRPVIAVGTTTVRTLESLPLLSLQSSVFSLKNEELSVKREVGQWEAYEDAAKALDSVEALKTLEAYMEMEGLERLQAATSIMIAPGFKWRVVGGMVTNFHQPQSTLLLLVSSLLDGSDLSDPAWRRIYREALDNGYRFLSYGDACLFLNDPDTHERMHEPCVPTSDSPLKSSLTTQQTNNPTTIAIPGSKSIAARALVCRLLGGHDTILGNLPDCGDTRGMLRLTEAVREELRVKSQESRGKGATTTVDIGEGGTTLRFGLAACASIPGLDIILTGSPRLMERPHDTLIEALLEMGADITPVAIEAPDGHAVVKGFRICGRELSGGTIRLDGSVSSQYISALMLAAPTWKEDTCIILEGNVVSRPYIEMTAGVMRAFGADVSFKSSVLSLKQEDSFQVIVRATGYAQCARYDIEGDWSGASYFFELRLIAQALGLELPDFTMPALRAPAESLQGDSRVAAIFAEASQQLNNPTTQQLNLSDAPDLVPAVAVGFCVAGLPFRVEGIAHLRHKETDRMAAIATELRRLGFVVATGDDYMAWDGSRCEPESKPLIRTYQDHRMAMAFAPARLAFPTLRIEDPTVVEKSFPGYWEEIGKIICVGTPATQQPNNPTTIE